MSLGMNLGMMNPTVFGISVPGEVINQSQFRIARNAVEAVNKVGAYSIQLNTSVVSGPAPLAVNFNAIKDSTFGVVARPLDQLSWWIDTGDSGATFQNILPTHAFGNSAEVIKGAIGGHVYESAGTYTAKVYVKNHTTGDIGYDEVEIVVSDADTYFAGTKTLVYSSAGDFTGKPTGAVEYTDLASALTAWDATGDYRLMLRSGESTLSNIEVRLRRHGGLHHLTSFGAGDIAELTYTSHNPAYSSQFYIQAVGYSFYNLKLTGDYNTVTGTGRMGKQRAIYFEPEFSTDMNAMVWRCDISGFRDCVNHEDGAGKLAKHFVIQDNKFYDWQNFGIISSNVGAGVCRGNSIMQNPLAVGGTGAKVYGEYQQPTASTTITHNIALEGDYGNLVIEEIIEATQELVRELVLTTDYTNTSLIEVEALVAPDAGNVYRAYHRRWVTHGPIRTGVVTTYTYQHNKMFATGGWGSGGLDNQPCIRHNSSGSVSGAIGLINENELEGGFVIAHCGRETAGNSGSPNSTVFEDNYLVCDTNTWEAIAVYYGGTTVRNNVIYQADMVKRYQLESAVGYGWYTGQDIAEYGEPVRIYNNTLIDERAVGNMSLGVVAAKVGHVDSPNASPDVDIANNLVYAPSDPVNAHTDYAPIDLLNYGAINAGSAAIDAGTVKQLVFDDWVGEARGETNSIGAFDTAQAVTVAAPVLSGTFNIADGTAGDSVNQDVSALRTSGDAATGWAFTGTPPTGLSISSVGVITGTLVEETLAGNSYGVKATNGAGDSNILLDADGITVSAATVSELTFGGVDEDATITPVELIPGDTITFKFKATGNTTYSTLIDVLDFRFYSSSRVRWGAQASSVTLDGVAITSGSTQSKVEDGLEHTIVITMGATSTTIARIGSTDGSEFYEGVIKDLTFDANGTITTYNIDSGSTTTESASVGTGTMTFNNVLSGDWS